MKSAQMTPESAFRRVWAAAVTGALLVSASATLAAPAPISIPTLADPPPDSVAGQLYRPQGLGPFPAVVLLHGCAGVEPVQRDYGAWLAEHGFEALVVDSYGPRQVADTCKGGGRMREPQAMDALGALRYLRARTDVDGGRIAVIGWSAGGGAALVAVAPGILRRAHPGGGGFRAAVALYPPCGGLRQQAAAAPVLLLLGGADDWEPAEACLDLAGVISGNGGTVSTHVYPGDTHAFDDNLARGHREVGDRLVTLRYDPAAAADAHERILAFLKDQLDQ